MELKHVARWAGTMLAALMLLAAPATALADWVQPATQTATPTLNAIGEWSSFTPSVATVGGAEYIAFDQETSNGGQLVVETLSGSGWTPAGTGNGVVATFSANDALDAQPQLANVNGTLYITWDR